FPAIAPMPHASPFNPRPLIILRNDSLPILRHQSQPELHIPGPTPSLQRDDQITCQRPLIDQPHLRLLDLQRLPLLHLPFLPPPAAHLHTHPALSPPDHPIPPTLAQRSLHRKSILPDILQLRPHARRRRIHPHAHRKRHRPLANVPPQPFIPQRPPL